MSLDSITNELTEQKSIIVAVVGAGISKASGMPTFRGEDGMWNQYHAQDLATPYAFNNNPNLVWEWYRARMRILLEAQPNPAHHALTMLEKEGILLGVITQNVDGLQEIAKTKNIVEVHGRIRYARCQDCDFIQRWDNKDFAKEKRKLPKCPRCEDSLLRPDVVWFGEPLNQIKWQKAVEWVNQANILLIIGTSGVVHPVASLPWAAKKNGAKLVEFNIEETPLTSLSDYSLFGPCEQILPEFSETLIKKYAERYK
ncbi:MAG: NAD-dependent deacylase [Candidatus Heimdallarchaeota archaeon]|nr:NAD-dependent deacylase [Candidatus Heimdallarchaeota archaeon]